MTAWNPSFARGMNTGAERRGSEPGNASFACVTFGIFLSAAVLEFIRDRKPDLSRLP